MGDMKFQFTIRDLILIVAIAALAAGWWMDHQRINSLAVQKWEYKTGVFAGGAYLSGMCDEGWEVCGVVSEETRGINLINSGPNGREKNETPFRHLRLALSNAVCGDGSRVVVGRAELRATCVLRKLKMAVERPVSRK
jgi:hypothetical protein